MSLLDAFTKKKKLTAAISQTAKARESEGKAADQLYKGAYHDYAEVLAGDPLRSEALYNWGFALLHQAKTKTGDEAVKLYQSAITKFSFCLLLNPSYLGAAINGGVAYMDLARLKAVDVQDELYELAKSYFEQANAIQAGSASYNLACIYGLRDEAEACLKALENSKSRGSLPDADEIINDPDMDNVKNQPWFVEFMATVGGKSETVTTETLAKVDEPEHQEAEPVTDKEDTVSPE
jgi:tetratricopeptide (TPR) repeat protein